MRNDSKCNHNIEDRCFRRLEIYKQEKDEDAHADKTISLSYDCEKAPSTGTVHIVFKRSIDESTTHAGLLQETMINHNSLECNACKESKEDLNKIEPGAKISFFSS